MSAITNFEIEEVIAPAFNANFAVTDLLMKTLENAAKSVALECVKQCGNQYHFDADEAIKNLGLENLSLQRKAMAKKGSSEKKEKAPKEPKSKKVPELPLPFCMELVNLSGCNGLAYNKGLFTQCPKKPMENGTFCKTCQAEADTSATGAPACGTITQRMACGPYEFKDSKGRSPVSYLKLITKLKISPEDAIEAAAAKNAILDEIHLQELPKIKKESARGRPKKPAGEITADGATDLFNQMGAEDTEGAVGVEGTPSKKVKLTEEEKAAKKAALEAERAAKKAEREAKAAADKAEREAKRKEESEIKKAEREAKAAAEKAAREEKRAAEKAERDAKKVAEKEAKEKAAAEKKAAKEAEKAAKEAAKKSPAKAPVPAAKPAAPAAEPSPAKTKVSVTRITIDGVQYLKTGDNTVYNLEKQPVGTYNPETKTITPFPEDDEEEEENYE